ncbi:DNA cytosine methyltransferase [Nitrosomonas sp. PY1]|uniref:DNA cytosine methyltransferase n=1 Tax=Nitrosomonas sp. PY1 TaxID=1803906 RepID=UPI001FC8B76A|nr:DNA cytosine methyltransferase [Nitrosomonas sp. PY1]
MTNRVAPKKKTITRPVGIDLFAGAGGMSLGFEQAGFDVAAAVEIDPIHCAIHKRNFPNCIVIPSSVADLTGDGIRRIAGLEGREIDCVFGGPPCQGFSMIGQRVLDDPRNSCVMDFVRLVTELDAKTFVFENVKGLTVGKQRAFLDELVEAFKVRGYQVRMPWRVLDAASYGVPQHRERLILFGARKDIEVPDYPLAITNPADGKRNIRGLPFGPTCEDALGDLPNAECFETLKKSDAVRTNAFKKPSDYAAEMRCMTEGSWHLGYVRDWHAHFLTSSARTVHTVISKRRFAITKQGEVEPISRFLKLSPTGLSNTLRAGTDGARGAFTSPRPIHYKYARCITVREMARLHGFPDWFRFHATKWHGARQIGNAVPPPLARAIAAKVVQTLGVSIKAVKVMQKLGDAKFLYMEMSEAAEHFGVAKPSSKRDRKSGAKKRKQSEIEAAHKRWKVVNG